MTGHLGTRVSALLDGRLGPEEEERAWAHVHDCHPCRDLVEREGWVKTRLAELSLGPSGASDRLKSSLLDPGAPSPEPAAGWSEVPTRPRQRGLVAIGGGAAGAAVVGVLALAMTPGPAQVERRAPLTELVRPTPVVQVSRPPLPSPTQPPSPTPSAGRTSSTPAPPAAAGGSPRGAVSSRPGGAD